MAIGGCEWEARWLEQLRIQVVRDAILHPLLGHVLERFGWVKEVRVEKWRRWWFQQFSGSLVDCIPRVQLAL